MSRAVNVQVQTWIARTYGQVSRGYKRLRFTGGRRLYLLAGVPVAATFDPDLLGPEIAEDLARAGAGRRMQGIRGDGWVTFELTESDRATLATEELEDG